MKEKITLTNRRGLSRDFIMKQLKYESFDEIILLQKLVAEKIENPDTFVSVTEEEVSDSLENDFCIGIFYGKQLAAFSMLVKNRVSERNIAAHLDMDESIQRISATYDIVFVHPDFRGFGLQKIMLNIISEEARRIGAYQILCTVSPDNPYSLSNLLKAGFEKIGERDMYCGVRRYIMRKQMHDNLN